MTHDTHTPMSDNPAELLERDFDDEPDSIGDHHRMAAHHFAAAAKHHLAAADADDEGDASANLLHAHLAYRHQLNAQQYAEIAAMDNDGLDDDEFDADFNPQPTAIAVASAAASANHF
jgi:hypothetical protein